MQMKTPFIVFGDTISNTRFARYVLLIGSAIILIFLIVGSLLAMQRQKLGTADRWVKHTYEVLLCAKQVDALTQRMLVNERGYLLSRQADYRAHYDLYHTQLNTELTKLDQLTADNRVQQEHMQVLHADIGRIVSLLEAHMNLAEKAAPGDVPVGGEVASISLLVQQTIDSMIEDETRLLDARNEMQHQEAQRYSDMLYGGIGLASIIIILLNALMLHMHAHQARLQYESTDSKDRFALAMKSTSDGIFDWNVTKNDIYYSPRFKQMLGYRDDELESTRDAIHGLVHADDLPAVIRQLEEYLEGHTSEFHAIYRIRHRSGSYLWLHARARAIFNASGEPLRMVGAVADITALKAIEERLRVEKDLAEAASRAKTDFLTNMSHEIRTPLNAIIGVSSLLSHGMVKSPEQERKLLDTLQHSSVCLLDLINDVLDLAKIESGEIDLDTKPFSLRNLMKQVDAIMGVRAADRGILYGSNLQRLAKEEYLGDESRIRQILINLIGNAIKFTEEGTVSVEIFINDGELYFRVSDSGIGIAPENLTRIFQKFEQVDGSMTRRYGGTGLGLAISQQLAVLMGGRITVESTPGQGSCFTLILPDHSPIDSDDEDSRAQAVLDDSGGEASLARSIAGAKRILIAEDFESNLLVIRFFMESLGIAYDTAHNGEEAVALYKKHQHPFVLMDVQMPGMNGLDATRAIREYEEERKLPPSVIIAMTAHALVADTARCRAAGMNDYLAKPLVESDIRNKISFYLNPLPV